MGVQFLHGWDRHDLDSAFIKVRDIAGASICKLLTFHFVSFLWVFFRAEDMERSLEILRRVFVFGQPGEGFPLLVIPAVLIGLALQLFGARLFAAFVDAQERLPWAVP